MQGNCDRGELENQIIPSERWIGGGGVNEEECAYQEAYVCTHVATSMQRNRGLP